MSKSVSIIGMPYNGDSSFLPGCSTGPRQFGGLTRFGVEVVTMQLTPKSSVKIDGPGYITLDLDVVDPAFAPGISHHEPGRISVREVLTIIQSLSSPIIGADIVELNPSRDVNEMTAIVAAKLAKEMLAKMLKATT